MKVLVAFLGWVGGAKNGDHQALRDTWLKNSGLDCKFFVGDGTPARADEEEVIERTYKQWTKNGAQRWADIKSRKKVDPKGYVPLDDEVMVPCPDSYQYLGLKRRESCKYMLEHGYDYMFFASVDVYARPERLMASGFENYDYLGMHIPTPTTIQDETVTLQSYCFGGGGWLSAKAAKIIVDSPITYWCEDTWIGMALDEAIKNGTIVRGYDDRYTEAPNIVTQNNDVISCHLGSKGEYDSSEMRRCHDLFTAGREVRILVAFLGWVGGAERGDHQALRDTWLKELKYYPQIDYRFFIGDGTPLPAEEDKMVTDQFEEWAQRGADYRRHHDRQLGRSNQHPVGKYEPQADEVLIPYPDGYQYLSYKRRESCRWALKHGYDYIFCASVDVYARPERMLRSRYKEFDYYGRFCGETGVPSQAGYIPESYIFGGGYWLSRKAAEIIAESPVTHWCEDWWVGLALKPAVDSGKIIRHMEPQDISLHRWHPDVPSAWNNYVSSHVSVEQYDNSRMYACHEQFKMAALVSQQPESKSIKSLWIGPLSKLERMCMKSFVKQGYAFELYCYSVPDGVPAGVVIKDAKEIVPADKLIEFQNTANFSDYFRWTVLYEKGGWWVDMDVYCLRRFNIAQEYVFSSQLTPGRDHDEPNCQVVRAAVVHSEVMRWLKERVERMDTRVNDWSELGPKGAVEAVKRFDLQKYVMPHAAFCPLHYFEAPNNLFGYGSNSNGFDSSNYGVHLWNEEIRRSGKNKEGFYPQSLYERLQRESGGGDGTVEMNFPREVKIQLDDGAGLMTFAAGVQKVPAALAGHWWLQHNGVMRLG